MRKGRLCRRKSELGVGLRPWTLCRVISLFKILKLKGKFSIKGKTNSKKEPGVYAKGSIRVTTAMLQDDLQGVTRRGKEDRGGEGPTGKQAAEPADPQPGRASC